ncbi:MAG: hypothetical protein AABX17_00730 [Nanoarchaeota archaeon]
MVKKTGESATTIKLSLKTKERLDKLKEYQHETYDEVLNKVLNIINISIKNPVAGARIFNNIKRKKLGKQKLQERLLARQSTQEELEKSNQFGEM